MPAEGPQCHLRYRPQKKKRIKIKNTIALLFTAFTLLTGISLAQIQKKDQKTATAESVNITITTGATTTATIHPIKKTEKPSNLIQPYASYYPVGGIGVRSSQHFFSDFKDMEFIDGVSHLEESY